MSKCPHCSGQDIETGVRLGMSTHVEKIGPKYKAKFLGMTVHYAAPLVVDLCRSCGTIVRFYTEVQNPSEVQWDTQS